MTPIRIRSLACLLGCSLLASSPTLHAQRMGRVEPDYRWSLLRPTNTGIPGDTSLSMLLDANDQPWIAGYAGAWGEGGMAHWDGETWFTVSNADYPAIASPAFSDMVLDPGGIIWIGSDQGLIRFDPAIGPRSMTRYDTGNTPLAADRITDVDIAPDGTIWMGLKETNGPGGLARFDPAANEWSSWTTANGLPWGEQWPGWDWIDFVGVAADPGGGYTVWFGSKEMGVGTYRAGEFRWFGNPQVPSGSPTTPYRLLSRDAVDQAGHVWMMTNDGLARRNPDATFDLVGLPFGLQNSRVQTVEAFEGGRAALGTYGADVFLYEDGIGWTSLGNWGGGYGSFTYALKEDSTGAIWACGIGGSAKLENGAWQGYRLTNTGMLGFWTYSIDFGPGGKVYMGDNAGSGIGGFSIFDGRNWTCVNDANAGLGPAWGLPGDNAKALTALANGHVALSPGLGQGLVEWDGENYTYLVPQGYEIVETAEDLLGGIWAARDNFGLFHIRNGTSEQYTWSNSPLLPGTMLKIVPDRANHGFVYVITSVGVSHTDGVTWTSYPRELLGLTSSSSGYFIQGGDVAADGTFWLGAGIGLYHLDPVSGTYEFWDKQNTPLPSVFFSDVEVAPDGSVWTASREPSFPYQGGLAHFDGTRWRVFSAGSSPLPHDQIEELNSRRTASGYELWIGTASQAIAVVDVRLRPRPKTTGF